MAYDPGRNPFNPLVVGAIAVIIALAAFLIFREGTDPTQQAGIESPPAITTVPGARTAPPGELNPPPTTPNPPANQPAPKGSGTL